MPNAKVFISYSHADAKILKGFLPFAKTLEREGLATVWHDGGIKTGHEWEVEINQAIREANVAVLFISQAFLASDFIWEKELPPLVDAWEKKTLTILLVFVSPSDAEETRFPFTLSNTDETRKLTSLQGFATPQRTLEQMSEVEQKLIFKNLNHRIRELANKPQPKQEKIIEDTKKSTYSDWALAKFSQVSLLGVEGGDISLDLERVFIPLRISQRAFGVDLESRLTKSLGDKAREQSFGDVELKDIFKDKDGKLRQCVVLFGEPGAGKTTSLKKILHLCLKQGSEQLALPHGMKPIFLRLRHFTEEYLHQPLIHYINKELRELSGGRFPGEFKRNLWESGNLLLLFDGLDEIADSKLRARVAERIAGQLVGFQERNIYAIVSCRYAGYEGNVRLENFFPLDVKPLDGQRVEEFVHVWFDEACKHMGDAQATEAKNRSLRLLGTMDKTAFADQRIKLLMGNPLLLTLLCLVVLRGGEIPRNRAAFYQKCLEIMLNKWRREQADVEPLLDLQAAMDILQPLAWKLHQEKRRDNVRQLEFANFAEQQLAGKKDAPTGLAILEWLNRDTGIFIEYAQKQYGFMHLGLQEYLAARHVVMSEGDGLLNILAGQADENWWREVLLLLVAIPGYRLFAPMMKRLLPGILEESRNELMRTMLTEAVQPDYSVFVASLKDNKTKVGELTALLRLLNGVTDPDVLQAAATLKGHANPNVSGLAKGLLGEDTEGTKKKFDLLLIHAPVDETVADQLASLLSTRAGWHPWPKNERDWAVHDWLQHLDEIRQKCRFILFLAGNGHALAEADTEDGLMYLGNHCRLFTLLLPDSPVDPASLVKWENLIQVDGRSNDLQKVVTQLVQHLNGERDIKQSPSLKIKSPPRDKSVGTPTGIIRKSIDLLILEPMPGLRLLPVPGGVFTMGDNNGDDDEKPEHQVILSPFYLAEMPVTNQQYALFLKAAKHQEPGYWREQRFADPRQPVVGVDWHDAMTFCAWLTRESGQIIFLPSEAQREYAARGKESLRYPWGDKEPTKKLACFDMGRNNGKPSLVGHYPAGRGPFGHLDLAGNVWEWCQDDWDRNAYRKRSGSSPAQDPVVSTDDGNVRPVRGGSWDNPAAFLRAALRYRSHAVNRFDTLSFRVAAPASTVDP
ncbi:MAG: SUMF1/EgtB/PvdO family nonheme iron enzyme [Magnetococcales bacterium]|nr:SUMF1/EgtB/PvdO family nonheme iron enzyme [Magnetococcales bacterium]